MDRNKKLYEKSKYIVKKWEGEFRKITKNLPTKVRFILPFACKFYLCINRISEEIIAPSLQEVCVKCGTFILSL